MNNRRTIGMFIQGKRSRLFSHYLVLHDEPHWPLGWTTSNISDSGIMNYKQLTKPIIKRQPPLCEVCTTMVTSCNSHDIFMDLGLFEYIITWWTTVHFPLCIFSLAKYKSYITFIKTRRVLPMEHWFFSVHGFVGMMYKHRRFPCTPVKIVAYRHRWLSRYNKYFK